MRFQFRPWFIRLLFKLEQAARYYRIRRKKYTSTGFDRRPKFEQFEPRVVMSATQPIPSLQNNVDPYDVNGNGQIEPADVLVIINAINAYNAATPDTAAATITTATNAQIVAVSGNSNVMYLDVDGNLTVDVNDAFMVTAYLNTHGVSAKINQVLSTNTVVSVGTNSIVFEYGPQPFGSQLGSNASDPLVPVFGDI